MDLKYSDQFTFLLSTQKLTIRSEVSIVLGGLLGKISKSHSRPLINQNLYLNKTSTEFLSTLKFELFSLKHNFLLVTVLPFIIITVRLRTVKIQVQI